MTISITTNYTLVWQVKGFENYKFTKNGICINTNRGKILKRVIVGGVQGYCLNSKFVSLKKIRTKLEKIMLLKMPF